MSDEDWVAHLDALTERVRCDDPTLTHLSPYLQDAIAPQPRREYNNNNNFDNNTLYEEEPRVLTLTSWSISSVLQQNRLLLEDHTPVKAALARLWEACSSEEESRKKNTSVRRVTLPSVWPSGDLQKALTACRHLQGLQEVYIVQNGQLQQQWGPFLPDVFHVSSLELETDLLPLLETLAHRMPSVVGPASPKYASRGLVHLHVQCRVLARSQSDVDQLAGVLAHMTHLQSLSLHLEYQQRRGVTLQQQSTQPLPTLDAILHAAAELSRPPLDGVAALGLQSLSLKWGDQQQVDAEREVVSVGALSHLLCREDGSPSSTLSSLCLDICQLSDHHLRVVAHALHQKNCPLRKLYLSGHGYSSQKSEGGVKLAGLRAVRDVLEHDNFTLQQISLYTPRENDNPMARRMIAMARRSMAAYGLDTMEEDDDEEESEYYRLQHQMEIFCRLNRLGRGALLSPTATAGQWVDAIAQSCEKDDNLEIRPQRRPDGLVDMGSLNDVYILLRTHPSLCNITENASRRQSALRPGTKVPPQQDLPKGKVNVFKSFDAAPPISVTAALTYGLRKKKRDKAAKSLRDSREN